MKRTIRKVLIANRGEIALRIIRTCREMGVGTVAVFSDIDREAMYVRYADEACHVGPPQASESYLDQRKILDAAKRSGADAIHPGYGFLSENAAFASLVESEGIAFIGPGAESMKLLGHKTSARRLAESLGIPTVPGTIEPLKDVNEAEHYASKVGYPVLLKAAGGGGGKGMRVVRSAGEMASSFGMARSEATSAFGDPNIFLEKYVERPRHIEVQVLCDTHGNAVHLGERECSVQRRHQKIIEESPSVAVSEKLRAQLVEAALQLVHAGNYVNAGTIEFILDAAGNFYFLEMNTRLQVEHPVTEMRTGIDLVREQIRIAEGRPLSFKQADIHFRGAALECRIYAEDSFNSFLPSTGEIVRLHAPAGFGVREDRGVEEGSIISPYYDPLLAKLVTWGATREECLARMARALSEYELFGVRNNLDLCHWIVTNPLFARGDFSTGFLAENFNPEKLLTTREHLRKVAALSAVMEARKNHQFNLSIIPDQPKSRWRQENSESMR